VLILTSFASHAFDLVAPSVDPLGTIPKVIQAGSTLPGDDSPFSCPVAKDFSTPLTLAEAVDLALCNNPQIKSTWASIKLQASEVGQTKSLYLPTFSLTFGNLQTTTVYPDLNGESTTSAGDTMTGTFSWKLFDFGGREASRGAANKLLVAAIANHDATLQKALSNLVQAYFDAQSAQAALKSKEDNQRIATATAAAARRREMQGLGSRGETLQATTALARASLEKGRAVGFNQRAIANLVYALGVPLATTIVLADDLRDDKEVEALRLEDWLSIATKTHPGIKAALAQWEAAKDKITATRAEGLPSLDFSANYYENGFPSQGRSSTKSQVTNIGLSLTIPVFEGFSRTYKIRSAEAVAQQRRAEMQDTENNILSEVVKAHADTVASVLNLQAAENLLAAAKESQETAQRRFDRDAADITEMLNTQLALSDAGQEHVRALSEWRSARLRLLAGAGLLGRTQVLPSLQPFVDSVTKRN
jgi:outer membrane protein